MPVALSRTAFRLAMLALALLIVLHWRIGPVVLSFDLPGAVLDGHGVHSGDGLALLPALLAVPRRRLRIDRRVGVKAAVVPHPGRRLGDRVQPVPDQGPVAERATARSLEGPGRCGQPVG